MSFFCAKPSSDINNYFPPDIARSPKFVLYDQLIPQKRSLHTVWNSSPTLKTSVGAKKTSKKLYQSQREVTIHCGCEFCSLLRLLATTAMSAIKMHI